jgi:RES domain
MFEYGATQARAAAANFLECDGLIVPNARFNYANLVLFTERSPALALVGTQPVDWDAWRRGRRR